MDRIEQLLGLDKLTIHQCQRLAKDTDFKGMEFYLCGPKGKIKCQWLDAYLGLFQIEGSDGFTRVKEFEFIPDIWCETTPLGEDK